MSCDEMLELGAWGCRVSKGIQSQDMRVLNQADPGGSSLLKNRKKVERGLSSRNRWADDKTPAVVALFFSKRVVLGLLGGEREKKEREIKDLRGKSRSNGTECWQWLLL